MKWTTSYLSVLVAKGSILPTCNACAGCATDRKLRKIGGKAMYINAHKG